MQPTDSAYRPDVDGLRALAVLSVVAFHAFPHRAPGGFVGVDVFFVISGFLITGILLRAHTAGTFTFRDFYARRARRIFPALALVLVTSLAAGWALLLNDELQSLGTHAAAGAGFISNFALWREAGYFDVASDLKPLLHLWSLGIEEQFYLVWPALLWIAWRVRLHRFVLISLILVGSFAGAVMVVSRDPVAAFYSPLTRFWELMVGGALAWLAQTGRLATGDRRLREVAAVGGLVAIAGGVVLLSRSTPFPGWAALLPTMGAALLIGVADESAVNRRLLAHPVMVGIGLISYPLYLWHWPLLAFTRIVEPEWMTATGRASLVVVAALLAWLTYRFVERPVRERRTSAALIAAGLVVVAGGALVTAQVRPNAMSARYSRLPNLATRLLLKNPHGFEDAESCRADFAGSRLPPDKCARQSDRPAIIVAGDSHGGQYYAGLQALGARSLVVWNGGCPPMHGFTVADKQCDARWTVIEEYLTRYRPDEPVVLLAAYTGAYLLPTLPNGARSDAYLPFSQDVDRNALPALFAEAFVRSVRSLRAQGFRVGVLLDGPAFPQEASECLASRGERCTTDRASSDARQAVVRSAMTKLQAADNGVQVFDPMPVLCPDGSCSQIIDGTLGYWDDDHWNLHGSRVMAEHLLVWVRDRFGVDALAK